MMKVTIMVSEDEIIQAAVENIGESLARQYSAESREMQNGIHAGTVEIIKKMIYERKEEIIEKCVARASAELVRKGLPKLIERMSKL